MLATTSTRCPSVVAAGSWAEARSAARSVSRRPCRATTDARSSSDGSIWRMPRLPSIIAGVPSCSSSARGSMPATAGRSSARARIAACDVLPPPVVQSPRTRRRSSDAVSDGVRSSAMTMASAGSSGGALAVPVRIRSTRRPTSRMSPARPARISFDSRARRSACARYACCHAYAADAPPWIASTALSSRSGSSRSSLCAEKMAALSASACVARRCWSASSCEWASASAWSSCRRSRD